MTTRDLAVIITKIGRSEIVIIVSAYFFHGSTKNSLTKLKQKTRRYTLAIGCNANSHHLIGSSIENNASEKNF